MSAHTPAVNIYGPPADGRRRHAIWRVFVDGVCVARFSGPDALRHAELFGAALIGIATAPVIDRIAQTTDGHVGHCGKCGLDVPPNTACGCGSYFTVTGKGQS